jgi:flagellar hook-length control protein FliK
MVLPVVSTPNGVHERAGPRPGDLGSDAQAFLAILATLLGLVPTGEEGSGNGLMPADASAAEGKTRELTHRLEESVMPDSMLFGVAQAGLVLAGVASTDGQMKGQSHGERRSDTPRLGTVFAAEMVPSELGVLTGLAGTLSVDDGQASGVFGEPAIAQQSASLLEYAQSSGQAALGEPASGAVQAGDEGQPKGWQGPAVGALLPHPAAGAGGPVALDETSLAAHRIAHRVEPVGGSEGVGVTPERGSEAVQRVPAGVRVWVEEQASDGRGQALTVTTERRVRHDDRPALAGVLPVSDTPGSRLGEAGPVPAAGEEAAAGAIGQVQERVAQAIAHGTRQLRVRLEPPDLGVVDVRIREMAGRLEVTLAANQPEVRQALEAGRESLRASLAAGGFAVQRVEVQPLTMASGQNGISGSQSGMGWPGGQQGASSDPGRARPERTALDQLPVVGDSRGRVRQESSGLVDTWA